MSFSILEIMRRLWSPRHEISCSWFLWRRLLSQLRERGHDGRRESGAFLIGTRHGERVRIVDFILYDDLDPKCLDTGIVRLDGRYFGALWDLCKSRDLTVVADVHTHPDGPEQSGSDQAHPMISRAGHVALIVPRFAVPPTRRHEVGMYRYQGAKRWTSVPVDRRHSFLHIGF
jgi:hypothetical protein